MNRTEKILLAIDSGSLTNRDKRTIRRAIAAYQNAISQFGGAKAEDIADYSQVDPDYASTESGKLVSPDQCQIARRFVDKWGRPL